MDFWRVVSGAAMAAAMSVAGMLATGEPADAQTRYAVATAAPTSGYYRMFSPAAAYINKHSKRLRLTPLSTDGSIENVRRVGSGQVKFGTGSMIELPDAWNGSGTFNTPLRDLRIVGPALAPTLFYFVVRKDSGVKTLADLAGKSLGCGAPGAAGTLVCKQVLTQLGLIDKVKVVELPYEQLTDMMVNRDLVGMVRPTSELPAGFAEELNVRVPLRILDMKALTGDAQKMKGIPSVSPATVPAKTYSWQPEEIHLFATATFFIANNSAPDDDVYEFVKLMNSPGMIDHMLNAFHGHGFYPKNKDPLPVLPFELHPGAVRFWQEAGVNIPKPQYGK